LVDQARRGDAQDVFTVHRTVLAEQKFFITTLQEYDATAKLSHRELQILEMDRASNSVFLVGRLDGVVVAFLTLLGGSLQRMRHAAKLEIMVEGEHRGKGIGKFMMEACIDWATRNEEIEKIGLNVFDDNQRARHLYERLGFVVEGHREREYRMADGQYRGDILMWRWVGG